MTQVESSHEPLFRDIKSNLQTASRAEKVFKEGVPINRRGERNVPKRYLQAAVYSPEEQGYFAYHKGSYIAVEFDFTHCFWYTIKYDNQESCWKTYSICHEPRYWSTMDRYRCTLLQGKQAQDASLWIPYRIRAGRTAGNSRSHSLVQPPQCGNVFNQAWESCTTTR